jgi:hypothetical protein
MEDVMKKVFGMKALLVALVLLAVPAASFAGLAISITVAPPVLPVYVQPPCPVDGYIWTPGYWAWGDAGYYWVPGVWVAPPTPGLLWTPGYWGFVGGFYGWHAGYWGPHVGFYGGVNYGFGYFGHGFVGGAWAGGVFRYNTAVVNVNRTVVRNVYVDRTVVNNTVVNRTSFNGPGGLTERANHSEQMAMAEGHTQPTATQMSHQTSFTPRTTSTNSTGRSNSTSEHTEFNRAAATQHSNPPASHGGGHGKTGR